MRGVGSDWQMGNQQLHMYRCHDLQHQTTCRGDDATGQARRTDACGRRRNRRVVGYDVTQAQNKYSKMMQQTMRTG